MVISINKKAQELRLKTPDLITRHVGRVMYDSIRKTVEAVNDGETLVLDFGGIKVIDSSFIDEMLVRLILDSRSPERPFFVRLKNVSEIAEINIDLVFRSYSNYKNKKIVVITENICQNNAFFIGPLSDRERDILAYLRVNKSITVDDVAAFTGRPGEEAKKIMDELYALRAARDLDGVYFSV